jgi:arylsulfatase A-like enzyme
VLAAVGEDTVVLVQSDHGGHGRSHGTDMDEDMLIPWLLAGPGVRRGQTLDGEVRIYDTCVTLAHLLGVPLAPEWDGRVVTEALA